MKTSKFAQLATLFLIAVMAMSVTAYSQGPTQIGTVSGSSGTITANQIDLRTGFEDEYNDGSTYTSVDLYYDGSKWYLLGYGTNGAQKRRSSYPLILSGGALFLDPAPTVMMGLCSIVGCSAPFPCSQACNESCPSGGSSQCTSGTQPPASAGYLGSFY